jgi:hypothetical protein
MSPGNPSPLELAKQGDAAAIAALLNRTLQRQGITAQATQEDGFLNISLESAKVPPKEPVVNFIHQGMTKLESEAIHTVKIEAYPAGKNTPAWSEEFTLETASLFNLDDDIPPMEEPLPDESMNDLDEEYGSYEDEGVEGDDLEAVPPPEKKGSGNKKGLLFGLIGLLALIALIGAGVLYKDTIMALLPFGQNAEEAPPPEEPATPQPPATTQPAPNTASPAATSQPTAAPPKPAPASDPWREGVNRAINAANLAQNAQTQAEWNTVAAQWQQAVDLMKKVPQSNPNYQTAQQKAQEYQKNLDIAKQRAATSN